MADIINLRQARKRKSRTEAEQRAAENRARFGRPKPETLKRKLETRRAARELDGKKLED
jgi:hypothetical protein